MKYNNIHILFVILLLGAKPAFANDLFIEPVEAKEEVVLFTDRSVYIVGEQVQFLATLFNVNGTNTPLQSQILYCELIAPDGNKITGNKYPIGLMAAEGCLSIPMHLLTGTYYLRAYTKLMRNYGPESYEYRQIRIINPYSGEVLAAANNEKNDGLMAVSAISESENLLSVVCEKTNYSPNDTIKLMVSAKKGTVEKIKTCCFSVVPETTKSPNFLLPQLHEKPAAGTFYFPDARGLSLSGKLTEASSQIPVKDKKINLSIIGEGRDFMTARTDSSGRFFFALPGYEGARDMFLCAGKTASDDLKIWIDNDFCAAPVSLPSPVFILTEQERRVALNMALNMQVGSRFYNDTLQKSRSEPDAGVAFYGKPSTILNLDEFIQLPTLEEYFNELPSLVKVRKHKGEKYFDIAGPGSLSFYEPLVMVDWVAVDEPSKILAVSPRNVSRIEFINQLYVKGDETYGGIISIVSKKGDFAGIDLPSTGIFINYQLLAQSQCQLIPPDPGPNHPDTRNTLLWKAGVSLQDGKSTNFELKAPDTPGRYCAVLEGITISGERFSQSIVFEVDN